MAKLDEVSEKIGEMSAQINGLNDKLKSLNISVNKNISKLDEILLQNQERIHSLEQSRDRIKWTAGGIAMVVTFIMKWGGF